ncbi:MAG: GntR family transcriptional regulator [Chloroflexi bacterium]|nr:GntR family transcriptional regulator [Chloroflexota bacterium]MCL5025109.1 GntR family transcriptional regulator [Chloroflexota bacterium]
MQSVDLHDTKTTLADLAYKALLKSIVSHELKPGDPLRAKDLAAILGISRTPVERALERLSGEGLVEFKPGMCPRVFAPTTDEVLELYDICSTLEVHAVQQGIDRVDDEFLDQLRRLLEEYEASYTAIDARKSDHEFQLRIREADRALHEYLVSLWPNHRAQALYRQLNVHVKAFLMVNRIIAYSREGPIQEHRRIYEALRARDVAAAVDAVRRHVAGIKGAFIAKIKMDGHQ